MIYLFTGTPGSGKSLHMARIIRNRLRAGKPVIANFECRLDMLRGKLGDYVYMDNAEFARGPKCLEDYAQRYWGDRDRKEGAVWVFIDEAQLLFNARSWNARGRDAWIHFFTLHRKLGYDIFLISQFDQMLDKQLRSLVEYQYIHRKVSNFGVWGRVLSLLTGGGLFCCVKMWYPMQQRLSAEFFKYHRKLGRFFDTYAVFHSSSPAGDLRPDTARICESVSGSHGE